MIADLAILPIGSGAHTSPLLAEILKYIRGQKIRYQLTATGTCLEGSWDQIMSIAKKSHEIARTQTSHVVTLLKIEDDGETPNHLDEYVASVEQKAEEKFNVAPR